MPAVALQIPNNADPKPTDNQDLGSQNLKWINSQFERLSMYVYKNVNWVTLLLMFLTGISTYSLAGYTPDKHPIEHVLKRKAMPTFHDNLKMYTADTISLYIHLFFYTLYQGFEVFVMWIHFSPMLTMYTVGVLVSAVFFKMCCVLYNGGRVVARRLMKTNRRRE